MEKTKRIVLLSALMIVFAALTLTANSSTPTSEDLEAISERKMLDTVEYIEDMEEIDLGFDPYFYLPPNFNAYKGMRFELDDIEYIELDEGLL